MYKSFDFLALAAFIRRLQLSLAALVFLATPAMAQPAVATMAAARQVGSAQEQRENAVFISASRLVGGVLEARYQRAISADIAVSALGFWSSKAETDHSLWAAGGGAQAVYRVYGSLSRGVQVGIDARIGYISTTWTQNVHAAGNQWRAGPIVAATYALDSIVFAGCFGYGFLDRKTTTTGENGFSRDIAESGGAWMAGWDVGLAF